jgi:hypothetical protein
LVTKWLVGFPVATDPLWQPVQFPAAAEWSKSIVAQDRVSWQISQALELGMWLGDLPRAVAPSWQVTQLPTIPEWSNPAVAQDRVS